MLPKTLLAESGHQGVHMCSSLAEGSSGKCPGMALAGQDQGPSGLDNKSAVFILTCSGPGKKVEKSWAGRSASPPILRQDKQFYHHDPVE